MPRATWIQQNFNSGEWSPTVYGRVGLEKYKTALATCLNYVPTVQGMLTRRPGTRYVAGTKSNGKVRLQRFEFSTTQAYVLEFGDSYIRFYTNDGQLLSGGSPYEVATTYTSSEIFSLGFTQSADVLYITHPAHAPAKLQRLGATSWTLSDISFVDGPYLNVNATATTFTSSAAGPGAATVTASAASFVATDVGRMIRLKSGATWGWGTISAYTDSTHVNVVWVTAVGVGATASWRLGVWGVTTGYPAVVAFHEDRLFFAGCTNFPQRLDGSNSSDYENFTPSAADGTVAASNGVSFSLNANTVNAVRWMTSDEKGLLVGTAGGEWVVRASSLTEALSATNVSAKQPTEYGSAAVQAVKVGKASLYVTRAGKSLREMAYVFTVDGFQSPDISLVSNHLMLPGIVQMGVQKAPQQVIWMVRNDGVLLSVTYDREQEVVGWARHTMGGAFSGGAAVVESVACIPSSDGTRDEVWVAVKRTVDGSTVRFVEYMTKYWETGDAVADAVYMDASSVYSGASTTTVSGLTWLKGQTVSVLTNGAAHPDCTVNSSGVITLSVASTKVQVGLGYNSDGKTLRIEAGGADGTAQGKYKRIHRVIFRMFESIGLQVLANVSGVSTYVDEPFRSSADPMDSGVGLFSGDKRWSFEGTWDLEGQVAWRQSQPLPSNIQALVAQLETQDGG
jgi:hypothetical protein